MALPTLRAATCHVSPHVLSAARTTQKTITCIKTAARHSANLVVFPESAIPGFPVWSSLLPPTQAHHFFQRMVQESVYVDGDEISQVRQAARNARVTVSLGISEKVRYSSATLFNTNLIIGEDGEILVHHRKLMPTFYEKLTWSPGDGHGLRVADTKYGKIGALICGENTNPLARYSLMAQGEQVHISSWPAIWPTRPLDNAADAAWTKRESRNYDNIAANRTRAAAHCFEAKCFGIMSAGHIDEAAMGEIAAMTDAPEAMLRKLASYPRAASQFLDPTGRTVDDCLAVDVATDRQLDGQSVVTDKEAILFADLDLNECIEGKQYHDVVGGYQRFDVFTLQVNRQRHEPVQFQDASLRDPGKVNEQSSGGNESTRIE
ncbi:nitrilase [Cladophialophora carrionii]|uniref:Nitrilase n=1 Tax=Cladophialophora carrionii TaxID=86049 RepID=A0A1C1CYR1_9EURO|nr:nitrilase [Cladophialophora carrionii]